MIASSSKNDFENIVKDHCQAFINRRKMIDSTRKIKFARSAYYMGSKVGLRSFILEGLSGFELSKFHFVDLMTGSGTMAGAFSDFGDTISSDAMKFPGYLSIVQGGGYSRLQAKDLLVRIKESYSRHYQEMKVLYNKLMHKEDIFLKLDDTKEMVEAYYENLQECPLYSISGLDIDGKINERKLFPEKYPYILFTEYFANVYFGVNQSVQIDSLRYAIDNIENQHDKAWALGALISTCSKIASSHAAHFAQPVVMKDKNNEIRYNNITKLLLKRRLSVWRDFEATLLSLAEESESIKHSVSFLEGPWKKAISSLGNIINDKNIIIYVDAPYTREEYSRYYHVLETLVKYDYPEVCGKGKLPSKEKGERFSSGFFTKTSWKIEKVFEIMFIEILS
jgi:adenine-specific DNA methylase